MTASSSAPDPISLLLVGRERATRQRWRTLLLPCASVSVVGEAEFANGAAVVARLRPEVVLLDPSGTPAQAVQVVRAIMAHTPTPIVVVSFEPTAAPPDLRSRLLAAGALAVLPAGPQGARPDAEDWGRALGEQIERFARIRVVTHLAGKRPFGNATRWHPPEAIAIVASTGGPAALHHILAALPANLPAGLVVVQHIAPGFAAGLADWLNSTTALTVKVAEAGETVRQGTVLLAPDSHHLRLARGGVVRLDQGPPRHNLRPSGDLLLESAAEVFGPGLVAVILTGMGSDGTEGLRAVKRCGGRVIAQDEASSAIYGMPRAALEAGLVDEVLPLDSIARRLLALCGLPAG